MSQTTPRKNLESVADFKAGLQAVLAHIPVPTRVLSLSPPCKTRTASPSLKKTDQPYAHRL